MLPRLQNSRVSYDFVQYAKFLGIMVSTLQHYHEVWALVRTDDSVGSKFCINSHWKKQILRPTALFASSEPERDLINTLLCVGAVFF